MDMNISLQAVALGVLSGRYNAKGTKAKLALAEMEIKVLRQMLVNAGIKPYETDSPGEGPVVDVTSFASKKEMLVASM